MSFRQLKGRLYLIPCTLGNSNIDVALPKEVIKLIHSIEHFIVENEKAARHFLGLIQHPKPIRDLKFALLNEHTKSSEINQLISPLMDGYHVGLLSEAGCPAIADPGAELIGLAQDLYIQVIPLVGPSSIILSLMASGLNGQHFAFLGYLPANKEERLEKIKSIEMISRDYKQTQIFIETPYRNLALYEDLIGNCKATTRLCIATNITCSDESIITKTISKWRQQKAPDINKQPTVFLMLA